jgi:hypothetical protein
MHQADITEKLILRYRTRSVSRLIGWIRQIALASYFRGELVTLPFSEKREYQRKYVKLDACRK